MSICSGFRLSEFVRVFPVLSGGSEILGATLSSEYKHLKCKKTTRRTPQTETTLTMYLSI